MTLLFEHTSEGANDEDDVTTAAGFGTPWSTPVKNGSATIKYDSAHAMHGTRSIRYFRPTSAGNGYTPAVLGAAVSRLQARAYVWMDALPTAQVNLFTFRSASGFMGYVGVTIGTTSGVNKLGLTNTTNTGIVASYAPADFPLSQWVRVEAAIKAGTTTSNGTFEYAYYLGDSGTAVHTYSSAVQNTGTVDPIQVRFGINGTTAVPDTIWMDDQALGDGASGWLGATTISTPTTIVNGQVVHLIDATSSTVASGTLTYGITQTSGTTTTPTLVATGIWKVVPHATSTLVYDVTSTGSLGGSDTESYSVPPLSAGTAPVVRLRKASGTFA